ncbi:hypothetical protein NP233_g2906 [Leucocoprinus birnbaumii]|uniref:Uncharacterized protein n=1 Tax=Leucocoprinus birnbaumii TaxID=56174 RepID=A0AAD5VXG2_9AGAR|nr:hypothetical protein NP233_g2906 [Leucocoprinus birnbaumii]
MASSPKTCPYCGRRKRPASPFGRREEELQHIYRELRRLDQLSAEIIEHIRDDQAVLHRRLRAIRPQDPCLPPRVLSQVLHSAFPSRPFRKLYEFPDLHPTSGLIAAEENTQDSEVQDPIGEDTRFPLVMRSVSFAFRRITLETPRFWTNIGLKMTPSSARPSALLLGLFLDYSKDLPLSIAIYYSFQIRNNYGYLVHITVDGRLIEAFQRIKRLHLIHPPQIWQKHLPDLSRLEECTLNLTRPGFLGTCEQVEISNGSIHQLSLHGALQQYDARLQLPWFSLTSLKLSQTSLEIVVEALFRCRSSLLEFYCRSPVLRRRKASIGKLELDHLEIFDWENSPEGVCSWALLKVLRVPLLKELRWRVAANYRPRTTQDITIFNRLPSSLVKLEVDFQTYQCDVRNGIDTSIERLSIHSCNTTDVKVLLQDLTFRRNQGLAKKMPALEQLTIMGGIVYDLEGRDEYCERLDESYADAVLDMVEGRWDPVGGSFTFELESARIKWPSRVKARLREMRVRGFGLIIRQHEREVSWMKNMT